MDPFQTFGIEPRFDVDLQSLEQRHRDLSRTLHPDRYSGAPGAERRLALSRAIEVNEAMRVLRDPIRRAEALLQRAGVAVGETSAPKSSSSLLMEMMEAREELGEAHKKKDLARVTGLGQSMKSREQHAITALTETFRAAAGDPEKLAGATAALGELRYVRRFLDEVSAIEEDLSP